MAATLRLGVFPFVSVAGLLAFLPPRFWDAAERAWTARGSRRLGFGRVLRRADQVLLHVDRALGRVDRVRPSSRAGVSTLARWPRRAAATARPPALGCLLALVLVWNAATLGYVAMPDEVSATVDPDEYSWSMFAPEPRSDDGWYVVPAELSSGETRDAFRGGAVRWDRPPDVAATYPDVRWYKYLVELQRGRADALGPAFGDYLCREWNASHGTEIRQLAVYYVEERVRLDEPETTERVELLRHSCTDGVAES